jgi:hypothetical protein
VRLIELMIGPALLFELKLPMQPHQCVCCAKDLGRIVAPTSRRCCPGQSRNTRDLPLPVHSLLHVTMEADFAAIGRVIVGHDRGPRN